MVFDIDSTNRGIYREYMFFFGVYGGVLITLITVMGFSVAPHHHMPGCPRRI